MQISTQAVLTVNFRFLRWGAFGTGDGYFQKNECMNEGDGRI